jgi:tRNA pseudouridine55 synthase
MSGDLPISGFLLIDKPAGITSHDVIDRLRKITGIRRIGHGGTLDPFATGLLVVGIGRATKALAAYNGSGKTYEATAVLGASSDTQDLTGQIVATEGAVMPDRTALEAALEKFRGDIIQTPPMYSAKKVGGKKLYELAREGKTIERKPVRIRINALTLLDYAPPRFSFMVTCSGGTYIRTLANDIGDSLGVGAYLEKLRRTAIGALSIDQAMRLESVTKETWRESLVPIAPRDERQV